MTDSTAPDSTDQKPVVVERTYEASVGALWDLWATKAGFESWWGPQGFIVRVHALEPRLGGALDYDMVADAPEAIAAMQEMGQAVSHGTHGRYSAFEPQRRLALTHVIDFIPDVPAYETVIEVTFEPAGDGARMVVTLHPHVDPEWTRMSAEGFGSQLSKLDARFGWAREA